MGDPFIGEIRIFPYTFAPSGWASCDGQLLPIKQYSALYAVIGITYGGDGKTNFALPNLKDRAAMNKGNGPGLTPRALAATGGAETATLTALQMAAHNHSLAASQDPADQPVPGPTGTFAQSTNVSAYQTGGSNLTSMNAAAVTTQGGGAAHNNMMPYLVVPFCIALQGIFPPRP